MVKVWLITQESTCGAMSWRPHSRALVASAYFLREKVREQLKLSLVPSKKMQKSWLDA